MRSACAAVPPRWLRWRRRTNLESRREDCPVCASTQVTPRLRTDDLLQNKPGRFQIDRCGDCFFRRPGWSNTYRVVAQKRGQAPPPASL
jgi:hypothetical protein